MMPYEDFVDPENVLRETLDRDLARLEAEYAGRRCIRDRFRFLRAERRLTSAYRRGRWFAKW